MPSLWFLYSQEQSRILKKQGGGVANSEGAALTKKPILPIGNLTKKDLTEIKIKARNIALHRLLEAFSLRSFGKNLREEKLF
jgi:hypothetical protein